MAKIVNLRTHRKQSARDTARRDADANAARHGRTKAERARDQHDQDRLKAHLDAHQRDRPE
jgi:hypothetical protein